MSVDSALDVANEPEVALLAWRARILNGLLVIIAVLAVLTLAFLIATATSEDVASVGIYGLLTLIVVALAIFRRLDVRIRAWGLLLVGYIAAIVDLMFFGLEGDGRIFLITLPALALILA